MEDFDLLCGLQSDDFDGVIEDESPEKEANT
eukprot:g973.t1